MKLRLLLALLCATPSLSLRAEPDVPEVTAPATADEIAYWKKLQAEISALRSANAATGAKTSLQFSVAELNAAMDRLENFLDARAADPEAKLGADLQAYRKELMAMADAAVVALQWTAKGKSTAAGSANFNPAATMENLLRASAQLSTVDGFKFRLYRLHSAIDRRMRAAQGPSYLFFYTLNLGDNPKFDYAASTPAQRDEKFVAASKAIDPALAVLAEKKFIRYRLDGRIAGEIEAKRDELLKGIDDMAGQLEKMSDEQLAQQLAGIPADFSPEERAMIEFAINREKLSRTSSIAASVSLQEWKAAFSQWLGKAVESYGAENCNHIALSASSGFFAYSPDSHQVVARHLKDGAIAYTAHTDFSIRGLVYSSDGELMAFTTGGLLKLPPPAGAHGEFIAVNEVAYQPLIGAISAATKRDRFGYAWGAAPAIADGGRESLFHANSSSRITAAAMNESGTKVLFGYSGQNDTGTGDARGGIDLLDLPESADELAKLSVSSRALNTTYASPITSAVFSADERYVAVTTAAESFGTVELFDLTKEKDFRALFALDNQAYEKVYFLQQGETTVLVAGSRNGVVRLWSVATGELLNRFQVPTGPSGYAMTVTGNELLSVALGAPGVYRWSLPEGKLVVAHDGDIPTLDPAKLASAFETEKAFRALIPQFREVNALQDPKAKAAAAETFLAKERSALEASGLEKFVRFTIVDAREDELRDLVKAKKDAEAFAYGKKLVDQGVTSISIYFQTINAARGVNSPELPKLIETALQEYPQSSNLRYQKFYQQYSDATDAGNIDTAMAAIDEIDSIYPEDRPHNNLRQSVLFAAADAAVKRGDNAAGMNFYIKSLDYCPTKKEQMNVLPSIFSLAYGLKNWEMSVRVASAMLENDPGKKNDQQFMAAARYAYQMQQQGKK